MKPIIDGNSRNVEEIFIAPEKREEIKTSIIKMENYKISVPKFVTKKLGRNKWFIKWPKFY